MAHITRYEPGQDLIFTSYSGVVTLEEVLSVLDECWDLAKKENCRRFLADVTNAEADFPPARIIELNEYAKKIGIPKDARSAVLVSSSIFSATTNFLTHMYKITSGTDGWPTQYFYDREQALEWLDL